MTLRDFDIPASSLHEVDDDGALALVVPLVRVLQAVTIE